MKRRGSRNAGNGKRIKRRELVSCAVLDQRRFGRPANNCQQRGERQAVAAGLGRQARRIIGEMRISVSDSATARDEQRQDEQDPASELHAFAGKSRGSHLVRKYPSDQL